MGSRPAQSNLFLWPLFSGLNENGEDVKWAVTGWPARILQHEVDHLNGKLNIERRQYRTPWDVLKNWIKWIKYG